MSFALGLIFAASTPFADLNAIDREVVSFTGVPMGEAGGATVPVDRRLRLRPCNSPLALNWRTATRDSVVVQCPDTGGWRLFVPVKRGGPHAQAEAAGPAINRGDAISIAVSGDGFTVSQPGEAMESGPIGGWIRVRPARTTRAAGEPMRAQVVRPGLVMLPLP